MQNLVYKTFELNTDVEHKAKPINISGATTIRLTNIPSNVKCWISTESNGTNLYPLINRGDGWSNLPNPLYNLYIYTEGTTIDNEKIILNYTGQNDFFIYGNNSSERIDRIGAIDSFSDKSMIQLNNAIFNTFSLVKPIIQTTIQGEFSLGKKMILKRFAYLPFGTTDINNTIANMQFNNDEYYRITIMGHFDIGGTDIDMDTSSNSFGLDISAHFAIFKNNNNAVYTEYTDTSAQIEFLKENFREISKEPYATKQDVFDIIGIKHIDYTESAYSKSIMFQDKGLNLKCSDFVLSGAILNQYHTFGILWNINNSGNNPASPKCHCSLLFTISKAYSNIIG